MKKLLGFFCLSAALAQAPSREGVALWPAARLQRYSSAMKARLQQGMASEQLASRGNHSLMVVRRDQSGEAEIHAGWHDIHIPQDGEAIIVHGGSLEGGRETTPGEIRGGRITGGTAQKVAAGDVLLIPAGTPHHTTVEKGKSVTVLIVKIEKK